MAMGPARTLLVFGMGVGEGFNGWHGASRIHTQAGFLGSWASPSLLTAPKSPLDVTAVLGKASGDTQPPLLPSVLTLVPLAAARPPACPPVLGGGHRAPDHQCRPSAAGHGRNQGIHGPPGQSGLAAGILCVSPLGPGGQHPPAAGLAGGGGGYPALLLICCWRCSEPCW